MEIKKSFELQQYENNISVNDTKSCNIPSQDNVEHTQNSINAQLGGSPPKADQQTQKSTKKEASINLFKGYIGSGILALPYAFDQAGYLLSAIIIFIIAFIIWCCVSYVIFFLNFFEHVFTSTQESEDQKEEDDLLYLLLALVVIIPLSVIDNVAIFVKSSLIANIFIIMTLLAIFANDFHQIFDSKSDALSKNGKNIADFTRIPLMIGVSIYSFEAVGIIFSIRNSLEKVEDFTSIFRIINTIVIILYCSFAVLGVLALGDNMKEIILFSLPQGRADIYVFQIIYAIALILSYPLQILPAYHLIESNKTLARYINQNTKHWKVRRLSIRIVVTCVICGGAHFIPRFAVFLNIIGCIAGTSLQFYFPIVMYEKVFETTKFRKMVNYFFLGIGVIGGIIGLVFSIMELATPVKED